MINNFHTEKNTLKRKEVGFSEGATLPFLPISFRLSSPCICHNCGEELTLEEIEYLEQTGCDWCFDCNLPERRLPLL